jgi:competence protein ComEC
MALQFVVFDVKRGLSVFVRTPNGYGLMVDCGSSDLGSPVDEIVKQNLIKWNLCSLAGLIITHPHSDHISEIKDLHQKLKPSILWRRNDLDWERVRNSNRSTEELGYFWKHFFPPTDYGTDVTTYPDWGAEFSFSIHSLSVATAERVSTNDNAYTNNSSYVIVIHYKTYVFVVTGDIEAEGMAELLKDGDFQARIQGGVHFLVCPHHGLASGYSAEWFSAIGATRVFNIVSEGSYSEQTIDSRYCSETCSAAGNNEERRMVSTRHDGNIIVTVHDTGQWSWQGKAWA